MSHEEQIVTTGRERSSVVPAPPVPRVPVSVRVGTMADFAFVDHWQSKQSDKVGWMPRKQLEGKIAAGHLLVAWAPQNAEEPVGFVISQDQYFKRDDVGIIYQLCVVPDQQRGLIGASLIKAVFERAAYGCRLFCCWCAQDLEANYFWESMGFVPLAFRTGAVGKKKQPRIHIFWQRRIRVGDSETPYWFPSETKGGSMREDRLVLPIPPGTGWRDVMPVILPGSDVARAPRPCLEDKRKRKVSTGGAPVPPKTVRPRHVQFGLPGTSAAQPVVVAPPGSTTLTAGETVKEKPVKVAKPKVKNDPAHVAAARELRDRYLEQFNAGHVLGNGKYDVARALPSPVAQPLQLPQAA